MIVRQRVAKGWGIPLRYAVHVFFAYPGVVSVGSASMTMNMKKHFVWNCYALTVQIVHLQQMKPAREGFCSFFKKGYGFYYGRAEGKLHV